ncbi:MAG TPA: hypothetical protein VFY83_13440, partial [Anaerolineales bacterium]|nr:hypothetical protein [Anaerolineales bacterium]
MQPDSQLLTAAPPRVFKYSLDWRFLLPMGHENKIGLLFEEDAEFSQTLERVGIQPADQLSLADLRDRKTDGFPVIVLPFGVPGRVGTKQDDRVPFYASLRRQIHAGGYLLVGFNNALNPGARSVTKYQSSTPRWTASELKKAGFTSVRFYGAMPDLQIPEYMFHLDARAIRFALQNRFRRKPRVLRALRFLAQTLGWERMSNFLP